MCVQAAISMLKHEYKETPTLQEALQLAIRVLNKTLDSTKLSSEKGKFPLRVQCAVSGGLGVLAVSTGFVVGSVFTYSSSDLFKVGCVPLSWQDNCLDIILHTLRLITIFENLITVEPQGYETPPPPPPPGKRGCS